MVGVSQNETRGGILYLNIVAQSSFFIEKYFPIWRLLHVVDYTNLAPKQQYQIGKKNFNICHDQLWIHEKVCSTYNCNDSEMNNKVIIIIDCVCMICVNGGALISTCLETLNDKACDTIQPIIIRFPPGSGCGHFLCQITQEMSRIFGLFLNNTAVSCVDCRYIIVGTCSTFDGFKHGNKTLI